MQRIDAGNTIRDRYTFLDPDGEPYDPQNVTFYVLQPSSEQTTYSYASGGSVVREDVGDYYCDVLIDRPGRFTSRWEGYDGAGSSRSEERVYVGKESPYPMPRPLINPPAPEDARWSPITATPCPMDVAVTPATFNGASTVAWACISHRTVGASAQGLKFLFGWWYGTGSDGEVMIGNGGTIRSWIKRSNDVYEQILFDGNTSYTFDPLADLPLATKNTIAAAGGTTTGLKNVLAVGSGATPFVSAEFFHVITEITVSNAAYLIPGGLRLLSSAGSDGYVSLGEGSGIGVFDPLTTEIVLSGESGAYGPLAVMGYGFHPSCSITGDSIFNGTGGIAIRQGNCGPAFRALTRQTGYALDTTINSQCGVMILSKGGEAIQQAVDYDKYKYRTAAMILANPRNIFCNYDTNDLSNGRTVSQIQADTLAYTKAFTNLQMRVIWNPLTPRSTSTDGWFTVGNQTALDTTNRTALKTWMVSGQYEIDALANGSPSSLVKVSNLSAGISCDASGAPNAIGSYFFGDKGPVGGHKQFLINTTNQLGFSSFRDTVNMVSSNGVSTNQFRGYTARVNSGANVLHQQSIRYNKGSNGTVGTAGFGGTHNIGDSGIINEMMTDDGTHPLDPAARLMALQFDSSVLLGIPQDVTNPTAPAWDPSQVLMLAYYDLTHSETLFQDSALTTAAVANNDPLGGIQDLAAYRTGRNLLQATSGNRPLLKTAMYNGRPFALFDGVDDFLRWSALATTIVTGATTAAQTFTSAAGFQAGDYVWFNTLSISKKILSVVGNVVTFDSVFASTTSNGEVVRRTTAQPVTYLMVMSVETKTASAAIMSGAHSGSERQQFFLTNPGAASFTLNASSSVSLGTVSEDTPVFIALVVDGANTKIYQNGLVVGAAVNPGVNPMSGLTIAGNNSSTPGNPSNIALGSFMVVAGAMTAYDIGRAYTYFKDIWGM